MDKVRIGRKTTSQFLDRHGNPVKVGDRVKFNRTEAQRGSGRVDATSWLGQAVIASDRPIPRINLNGEVVGYSGHVTLYGRHDEKRDAFVFDGQVRQDWLELEGQE